MVREYMPTLYEADESEFTSNGYGFLADGISCEVTEEIGNSFELEMQYPVTGVYYDLLQIGNVICCRTNTHKTTKQPFRIYRITKPIDGIVTIYAQHISYDLAGYTVDEVNTTHEKDNTATVKTFITFIQSCIDKYCRSIGGLNFTLATNGIFEPAAWSVTSFTDARAMMRQAAQLYNGQWEYNGTTCTLYRRRGEDRGVTIEYGKNLTGIREDADISSTYTHIMPYYKGTEGEGEQRHDVIVGGLSATVATGAEIGYNRTKGLDLSSEYRTTPTIAQLQERAKKYIAVTGIGKIVISRDVEAIDRGKTVEYPQLDGEDIIEIGDTIGIIVPVLGISASMDCMRLTYDAYLDCVKSYEIGDIKENFISMVADDDKEVKNKIDDIDDWIDDTDDRLDNIEEALNERAPTLYVQEDEPEGTEQDPLVSGDEWLQIDEERNAIAYYKYSSSWSLQCYFGGRFDPIIQSEQPIDTTSTTEAYDLWLNIKGEIADTDTLANINIANVRGMWEKGSGWEKKAYGFGKTNPVATVTTQQGDYWYKTDNDGLITELSVCTSITIVGSVITATWAQIYPTDETEHSVVIYLENREPVKQGDYWLKIQNGQSKLAQQLGQWNGSQWDLVLDFGDGGGGVGEFMDTDHTSERFNDYREHSYNQTQQKWVGGNHSDMKYDHVEGFGNKVTVENQNRLFADWGCNHVEGYENFLEGRSGYGQWMHLEGYHNSVGKNSYASSVGGLDNNVEKASICLVHGRNNNVESAYCSAIFGEGNTVGYDRNRNGGSYNGVFGNNNVVRRDYCVVIGYGIDTTRSERDFYFAINGSSSETTPKFTVDGAGNCYGWQFYAERFHTSGADYAEYFEWADGNPDCKDRCGMLVELSGDKIIPAHGDDIFGIVSAVPSVCANAFEEHWHGRYRTDVYGRIVTDSNGEPVTAPDFDPARKYIPRSKRPEWAAVGITGRLVIADDGSCKVGGYVSARHGVGTSCYINTGVKVLRRLDDTHVEVVIK